MEIGINDLYELMGVGPKETMAPSPNPQWSLSNLLDTNVIIRTVTHYYTGHVDIVDDRWLVLSEAAWIADTGRWSDALATGKLNEVEPYPDFCYVSLGGVVDIAPWRHALPRDKK